MRVLLALIIAIILPSLSVGQNLLDQLVCPCYPAGATGFPPTGTATFAIVGNGNLTGNTQAQWGSYIVSHDPVNSITIYALNLAAMRPGINYIEVVFTSRENPVRCYFNVHAERKQSAIKPYKP